MNHKSDSKHGTRDQAVDLDFLKRLSDWMHEADVHEVTLEDEDRSVHVVRRGQAVTVAAPAPVATAVSAAPESATHPTSIEEILASSGHIETSPMVGVAYLAPSPNDPPFVEVGKTVRVGDPLLVIEAMKVMNQIQTTKAGVVKQILVENGEALEFDQPLVVID
ncbi:MAG: acetyl-CoA carboxylase biotin carboxyl carrier protein [Alphaproteobacteria bacterium]|nr:acetyl-CoA carboxylase biotin carboxyl carrier protein [Alphaproteobacteria bacterium]